MPGENEAEKTITKEKGSWTFVTSQIPSEDPGEVKKERNESKG